VKPPWQLKQLQAALDQFNDARPEHLPKPGSAASPTQKKKKAKITMGMEVP